MSPARKTRRASRREHAEDSKQKTASRRQQQVEETASRGERAEDSKQRTASRRQQQAEDSK
jgi:hypothetical protein